MIGVSCFDRLRSRLHDEAAFLYAFDLLEIDGQDLRREPLAARKAALASVVIQAGAGLQFNEHIEADGALVFGHACKLGLEGIVSKRRASAYPSGPSRVMSRRRRLWAPSPRGHRKRAPRARRQRGCPLGTSPPLVWGARKEWPARVRRACRGIVPTGIRHWTADAWSAALSLVTSGAERRRAVGARGRPQGARRWQRKSRPEARDQPARRRRSALVTRP
jgi:ATP dependent DNA ligase domain